MYKPTLDGTFIRKEANGFGYELWLPDAPRSFDDVESLSEQRGIFQEVGRITQTLQATQEGGLLIWGEPGVGKSHIRDDLVVRAALEQDVPYLSLTMHINGGHTEGPKRAATAIRMLQSASDSKKLIIFDNIDFIGYRGHRSRTRTKASRYASEIEEVISGALADPNLAAVGTAHDPSWRAGRWTWDDPTIDEPAQRTLDAFTETMELSGDLTDFGMIETLYERGTNNLVDVATLYARDGLKTFFYVNHLDPELYKESPERAIAEIRHRREEMKHR